MRADFRQPSRDAKGIWELALSICLILLTALVLAVGAALLTRVTSKAPRASLGTSVWWEVLRPERVPRGKLPYALITLTDDKRSTIEGVLAAYTWQSDSAHYRDVALRSPIKYPAGRDQAGQNLARKPDYDFVIIAGSDIRQIAIKHVADGKDPHVPRWSTLHRLGRRRRA